MPVSTLRETASLTNQQIADFALQAHQAARAASARGDAEAMKAYQAEADALAKLLK